MTIIKKKIWPKYFEAIASGKKKYELRLNDFDVHDGDILFFFFFEPETKLYTGRNLQKVVTNVGKFRISELFWSQEEIEKYGIQIISLE